MPALQISTATRRLPPTEIAMSSPPQRFAATTRQPWNLMRVLIKQFFRIATFMYRTPPSSHEIRNLDFECECAMFRKLGWV
jgi:hypothetical protein